MTLPPVGEDVWSYTVAGGGGGSDTGGGDTDGIGGEDDMVTGCDRALQEVVHITDIQCPTQSLHIARTFVWTEGQVYLISSFKIVVWTLEKGIDRILPNSALNGVTFYWGTVVIFTSQILLAYLNLYFI